MVGVHPKVYGVLSGSGQELTSQGPGPRRGMLFGQDKDPHGVELSPGSPGQRFLNPDAHKRGTWLHYYSPRTRGLNSSTFRMTRSTGHLWKHLRRAGRDSNRHTILAALLWFTGQHLSLRVSDKGSGPWNSSVQHRVATPKTRSIQPLTGAINPKPQTLTLSLSLTPDPKATTIGCSCRSLGLFYKPGFCSGLQPLTHRIHGDFEEPASGLWTSGCFRFLGGARVYKRCPQGFLCLRLRSSSESWLLAQGLK